MDLGMVLKRFDLWKKTLPRVEPFYAVKCNSDPILMRVLADCGAGFDCASKKEIDMVRFPIHFSHQRPRPSG